MRASFGIAARAEALEEAGVLTSETFPHQSAVAGHHRHLRLPWYDTTCSISMEMFKHQLNTNPSAQLPYSHEQRSTNSLLNRCTYIYMHVYKASIYLIIYLSICLSIRIHLSLSLSLSYYTDVNLHVSAKVITHQGRDAVERMPRSSLLRCKRRNRGGHPIALGSDRRPASRSTSGHRWPASAPKSVTGCLLTGME